MIIYSIFQSIEGEVNSRGIGAMTTFIRFAGCHASCPFCDTEYAKNPNSGKDMEVVEIMDLVSKYNCTNVTITGGEPLEQMDGFIELVSNLVNSGYNVSVETNGFHLFSRSLYPFNMVNWIVDIKTFGPMYLSHYMAMNLTRSDFLKMVIGSRDEFREACNRKLGLQNRGIQARFAFSPEFGKVTPDQLVKWMKEFNQQDAVLNIQLHKIISLTEDN